jgi:hypothetical protein
MTRPLTIAASLLAHETSALILKPRIEDSAMAKGQKKSNKETRKPKTEKPKVVAAQPSFLTPPTKKK